MEYIPFGDLGRHIPVEGLPEAATRQIVHDLLFGLRYMHAAGFTHRDLKPKNIFVISKPPVELSSVLNADQKHKEDSHEDSWTVDVAASDHESTNASRLNPVLDPSPGISLAQNSQGDSVAKSSIDERELTTSRDSVVSSKLLTEPTTDQQTPVTQSSYSRLTAGWHEHSQKISLGSMDFDHAIFSQDSKHMFAKRRDEYYRSFYCDTKTMSYLERPNEQVRAYSVAFSPSGQLIAIGGRHESNWYGAVSFFDADLQLIGTI